MPTRPRIAGRERRVYALVCSLPFSGAQTAHFSFDMTIESFLEGHVRAFDWLGGVPRECVYDNLRSAVARRDGEQISWNPRFLAAARPLRASTRRPARPRRRARRARSRARSATSRPGSGRRGGSRRLAELDEHYADWRDRVCNRRRHATGRLRRRRAPRARARGAAAAAAGRVRLRPGGARRGSRSTAISSSAAASTGRRRRWSISASSCAGTATASGSATAARRRRYPRSYDRGIWLPPPRLRPEPPTPAPVAQLIVADGRAAGAHRLRRALRMSRQPAASASGCPTCCASSRRRASSSAWSRPPTRARAEGWPYEQFLEALLRGRGVRARRLRRAPAASATPRSRPTRRSRTSTSPPSPPPRSR